jgi:hypothetical protein
MLEAKQNLDIVMNIAIKYHEQFGTIKLIEIFEITNNFESNMN